jgi:hypothetical protein
MVISWVLEIGGRDCLQWEWKIGGEYEGQLRIEGVVCLPGLGGYSLELEE